MILIHIGVEEHSTIQLIFNTWHSGLTQKSLRSITICIPSTEVQTEAYVTKVLDTGFKFLMFVSQVCGLNHGMVVVLRFVSPPAELRC